MILHTIALAVLAATQQSVDPLVSTAWLAEHLQDPNVVVIHVDSRPERYDEGHIPGARFVRYEAIASDGGGMGAELPDAAALENALEAAGVNDDSHVVIYSVTRVLQATRLWFTLELDVGTARSRFPDEQRSGNRSRSVALVSTRRFRTARRLGRCRRTGGRAAGHRSWRIQADSRQL